MRVIGELGWIPAVGENLLVSAQKGLYCVVGIGGGGYTVSVCVFRLQLCLFRITSWRGP